MRPVTGVQVVRNWLQQVREMAAVAEQHRLPPMAGVYDIRDYVRAAAFPAPLEPEHLAQIAETLGATGHLRDYLDEVREKAPSLQKLSDQIRNLTGIADEIRKAIDERGAIRDYASARLQSIRRAIVDSREKAKVVFERLLRQGTMTKMLQYGGATFHNDRMVLPLKSEYRGRVQGIIHRTSDSGATLFVEPAESVELNNTVIRLREDESKEITRILQALTQIVRENAPAIQGTVRAIGVLDLISAKCRYAKKRGCVSPEIDDGMVLRLHSARHPLLIELFDRTADGGTSREIVPIDVRLGDDFDVLVITGPNTGGKTVTLKTVGLLALMTQCGIPIPVEMGSRMPVFDDIRIDIGDEQSLQQSLSTFSSHLATILDILQHSHARTLVLIDELGAGTDPDEGAAIGRATLAELLTIGAKAIVTTHLSALKAVAFTSARIDNGAVEFDPETLRPTYHLRLGEPGNSNALIIAKRLGMPARLVQMAKGFLDDRSGILTKAIEGTLHSRREAEEARKVAHQAALEAQQRSEKFEHETEELRKTQESFERWTSWINALKPGDPVFVRSLKRPAKVVRMQLHKQMALVSAGALDLEVPIRDIQIPTE